MRRLGIGRVSGCTPHWCRGAIEIGWGRLSTSQMTLNVVLEEKGTAGGQVGFLKDWSSDGSPHKIQKARRWNHNFHQELLKEEIRVVHTSDNFGKIESFFVMSQTAVWQRGKKLLTHICSNKCSLHLHWHSWQVRSSIWREKVIKFSRAWEQSCVVHCCTLCLALGQVYHLSSANAPGGGWMTDRIYAGER